MDAPPSGTQLVEKARKFRILGKITASLEAAREGRLATARELIREAADMIDLELEDE